MNRSEAEARFLRRVIIATAVVAAGLLLLWFVWRLSHIVLVTFAAVLFAVLLDGMTRLLQRATRIPRRAGLALVLLLATGSLAGFGWAVGPSVSAQLSELSTRIPTAVERLAELLHQEEWGRALLQSLPPPAEILPPAAGILGPISGVFSTTVGAVTNAVIALVAGAFMAIEPRLYVDGLLKLLPPRERERGEEVVQAMGRALSWWLIGRVASMVAVGLLTALGLWLIDMPLVLALALIAGLLSFVPYLGPILSAVPALLVALVASPLQAVYVLLVYAGVQFLEGDFITPIIQERTVSLPPAVLLIAQLGMGVSFGLMGVLLATPLAVVAIVLVQMLYVRDTLGDSVRVLGEHRPGNPGAAGRSGEDR